MHGRALAFVLLVACGTSEGSAPAPREEPPRAPVAPAARDEVAVERPAAPTEVEAEPEAEAEPAREPGSPADAAAAAYRALTAAFRRGDREAYLSGYAERLRCFYGRRDRPRDALARSRGEVLARNAESTLPDQIRSIEVRVLRASADEVELADFGWTGPRASDRTTFHQKRIVLARDADAWRVVVETSLADRACGLAPVDDTRPPPLWKFMRDAHAGLLEYCVAPPDATADEDDPEDYPGIGGSIGCDPHMAMQAAEELCLEVDDLDASEACLAHTREEVAAYVGDG